MPLLDVAVLSSKSESFSNATLEYAAMGLPIVVTDVGGQREIVRDGFSGYLVPPEDPTALAEKIDTLLGDSELRNRLGRNAEEYAWEHFGESPIIEQYLDYYRRCFSGD
jgi:glycosyltransferase involved in cell wall biosynthesis